MKNISYKVKNGKGLMLDDIEKLCSRIFAYSLHKNVTTKIFMQVNNQFVRSIKNEIE